MTDRERRSVAEVLLGKPRAWVVWGWLALAIAWIIIAVVEPSGFRTFMAIAWSVLAVFQIVAFYLARRRRRPAETGTRTDEAPPR
ncbi:hypothetical protein [Curtobacterium sp. MCSS17_016]|uniref:hypothetical protein n=1 Tax=Curtobacterium sp. MCSS17_016 TaxID=2175644 RepID=UPI0011B6E763|nr:hypothetical protein [Curtobacterium sp. MCSS17_016]WIE80556.1 hypothetical protein DEJ19_008320 [Curtobacterium sp. MCSS17_016]